MRAPLLPADDNDDDDFFFYTRHDRQADREDLLPGEQRLGSYLPSLSLGIPHERVIRRALVSLLTTASFRAELPQEWNQRLDDFQKILFLKCLRPDKVTNAMQDYVSKHLGQKFIEPQVRSGTGGKLVLTQPIEVQSIYHLCKHASARRNNDRYCQLYTNDIYQ